MLAVTRFTPFFPAKAGTQAATSVWTPAFAGAIGRGGEGNG